MQVRVGLVRLNTNEGDTAARRAIKSFFSNKRSPDVCVITSDADVFVSLMGNESPTERTKTARKTFYATIVNRVKNNFYLVSARGLCLRTEIDPFCQRL